MKLSPCMQHYKGVIINNKTNLPLENVLVLLQDSKSKYKVSTKTNDKGIYEISFPCDKLLIFKASLEESTEPYYAEYNEFIETDKEYNKNHNKNISLMPVNSRGLISDKNGNILIPTNPIYFKYNSDEIESNSFIELDKVGKMLLEHPEWILYIEAHSDIRGSDSYNLSLSNKRANKTKEYLVKFGINLNSIKSKGFGESKPLINCENKECGEEEHAINRRSEFIIK
ncbi:MAG: OmpA family protein [Flavobacterium sp.]|nr:OmpA family protein [Flavobacterium sp.]